MYIYIYISKWASPRPPRPGGWALECGRALLEDALKCSRVEIHANIITVILFYVSNDHADLYLFRCLEGVFLLFMIVRACGEFRPRRFGFGVWDVGDILMHVGSNVTRSVSTEQSNVSREVGTQRSHIARAQYSAWFRIPQKVWNTGRSAHIFFLVWSKR